MAIMNAPKKRIGHSSWSEDCFRVRWMQFPGEVYDDIVELATGGRYTLYTLHASIRSEEIASALKALQADPTLQASALWKIQST